MMQNFTALNTMHRKTPGKQTTYRSPKGTEKQIDFILIKRRHLKYSKDAEANDMIHIGSDHRCVMATLVINTPKKNGSHDADKDKHKRTKKSIRTQTGKKDGETESSTFEKRYQELEETIKPKSCSRKFRPEKEKIEYTMEAEGKKEDEKKGAAQTVKAEAESDTRETR